MLLSLKMWFNAESRLNCQCHNPRWIQFRHDKFRIARWRENPYKDRNTLKTNIMAPNRKGGRWMTIRHRYIDWSHALIV